MIYEIEFSEIGSTLLMYQLDNEDIMSMPFDGAKPAKDTIDALERVLWTLNACVTNLEEVKDAIKATGGDKAFSHAVILGIYQCCVALNPVVDMVLWNFMIRQKGLYHDIFNTLPLEPLMPSVANPEDSMGLDIFDDDDMPPFLRMPDWLTDIRSRSAALEKPAKQKSETANRPIDKKRILTLKAHLDNNIIGQPEVIDEVVRTFKRSLAGLKDDKRPIGVFMLCGSSGVGKTHTAKMIQEHLFGKDSRLVRVDCGEFMQKHEVMKLTGSPNSYVGFEEGGQLTNAIKAAENTVLLLDEAEKAHPDFWNLFLKIFDEGYLTDNKGENISFENTVIIMTSNLGNEKIAHNSYSKGTGFNASINDSYDSATIPQREYVVKETKAAINKFFKPEFLNRVDEVIIFNYLTPEDLEKVARLEFERVALKLAKKNLKLRWSKTAEKVLASKSIRSISGARAMAKIRRSEIEDPIADMILDQELESGTTFQVGVTVDKATEDTHFTVTKRKAEPKVSAKIQTSI